MARFLYADWDERLSAVVREHFESLGHQCDTAVRGRLACEMAEGNGYDVVVSEVMLPDMCGFELCRRVRANPSRFTTPIVLVSTMSAEEEIQHGIDQGADFYLPKPYDFNHFTSCIQSLADGAPSVEKPDPLTLLSGHQHARYMLQHYISARKPFALVCMELVNLVEFGQKTSISARNKALRHAARILEAYGRKIKDDMYRPAHMGAGYFICLVSPDLADPFCASIRRTWSDHQKELYESLGVTRSVSEYEASRGASKGVPPVNSLLYYTHNRGDSILTAKSCLETLKQIRELAVRSADGIYQDRRIR